MCVIRFGEPTEQLHLGMFVFLRNARFRPERESPVAPRYWVARIRGTTPPTDGQDVAPGEVPAGPINPKTQSLRLQVRGGCGCGGCGSFVWLMCIVRSGTAKLQPARTGSFQRTTSSRTALFSPAPSQAAWNSTQRCACSGGCLSLALAPIRRRR